jgi:hypothetical protein
MATKQTGDPRASMPDDAVGADEPFVLNRVKSKPPCDFESTSDGSSRTLEALKGWAPCHASVTASCLLFPNVMHCKAMLWLLLLLASTLGVYATSCSEKETLEVPIVGPGVQLGALFNAEKMGFTGREFWTRGGSDPDYLPSDIEKTGAIKGSSGYHVRIVNRVSFSHYSLRWRLHGPLPGVYGCEFNAWDGRCCITTCNN